MKSAIYETLTRPVTSAIVTAFFDGLTEPTNPGGYACGGWYVPAEPTVPGLETEIRGGRFYANGAGATNNMAEYSAALDALRVLYKAGWRGHVMLRGDSQLVVKQFNSEWACNPPHLQTLLRKLRHAATFFESVSMLWVPRAENSEADEQSRLAYRRQTGREAPVRVKR